MPTQEFFTPVAFDFLWESAGIGELPYPLRVRSHGRTELERRELRRGFDAEFAARDIPGSHVEEWLALLARPSISIDALFIPEFQAPPVAALAASDGRQAVLAVQDATGVSLRPAYPDGLVSAVVDLLPQAPRGSESSITIPIDEALRTEPARSGVVAGSGAGARRRTALSERTTDPRQAYAQLIAQPRSRGGQLAANSRDDLGAKRRSAVLAWFDTATGRYLSLSRPGTDGREWVTVSPADAKTLRSRLGEMVAGVAS
ncbi:ESX secretion-associated protein EspG [Prauserella cavernicola]|uniref:ESX secretion-associated protein EspG n=1 Tax=Prauserella cavernicola TaxID=2800127 RepID=A0A934V499_9PSEU|nr:ESX secretion-associated protein EspG [Prauserella cavernicola]MBK1785187.1 ESX secretion-associated protein EspG [Prauserella cavernicola]